MAAIKSEERELDYSTQDQLGERSHVDLDDPHRAALEDNPEEAEKLPWSTLLAVFFLGLSFVAPISLGFLLVTAILFPIGTALGDTTTIVWIAGGWSIASSVSFSIAGSLSDIFGRRNPIIAGQILTIVGAIVGGTAQKTTTVVAGSTIIGFGCGVIFVAYAGIPELLPNKYRGIGLGFTEFCINIPWASFSVLLAALLSEHASWRWCYYFSVIYAAICLVGTVIFYFPPSRPRQDHEKTRWDEVKELDYIGIILYSSGLTVFLIGLTWAGEDAHPWNSASVIAPIVIGFCVLISCFAYEFTLAKQPFFPWALFKQVREFSVLLVTIFVSGMVFYSMTALLPQGTLYMFNNDLTRIGIIAIPSSVAPLIGGWVIPSFMHRIKRIRAQMIIALILQTLFTALYAVAIPNNLTAWMAFQFFGQGCFTLITTLAYVTASLHVPQVHLGVATGLIGTFRSAGGSVGNSIFTTIRNSEVNSHLAPRIAQAALSAGFSPDNLPQLIPAVIETAVGIPFAFVNVTGATPEVQAVTAQAFKDVYAHAYKLVFYSTIPFGVFAIVAAFFVIDPSPYLTNHVAVHMEKEVLSWDRGTEQEDQEASAGGKIA